MAKHIQPEFKTFQKEFKKYQNILGLNGYRIYFFHEPLENSFADITVDNPRMCASVRLASNCDHKERHVKHSAKHEALHLLISRLQDKAFSRYVREEEIMEADEEIVMKLEELIP
jgi:hypothetical protein